MFDLESERMLPHPRPSPYFLLSTSSLVKISFFPQPSAAIKIKAGGHDFYEGKTEHLLAKIMPTLQAR